MAQNHTRGFGRTIEDEIADADEDYVRARNSAVAWSHDRMDDGPENVHDRRYESVIEGEKRDLKQRRSD